MSSHHIENYLSDSALDCLRNAYKSAVLQKALFHINPPISDTALPSPCQQKSLMIDRLIDISAEIIDSIWLNKQKKTKPVLSTRMFIRELLQRSRATYSMLQLALFYIFRIKKLVSSSTHILISCSRRMFLAALILASKYLHDRNYRTQTWAKIANLSATEIAASELVFLKLIDYRLYVSKSLYDKWVSLLYQHIHKHTKENQFISTAQPKSAVSSNRSLSSDESGNHDNDDDDDDDDNDNCSEASLPNSVCSSSSCDTASLHTPPPPPSLTKTMMVGRKRPLEEQEDRPISKYICLKE